MDKSNLRCCPIMMLAASIRQTHSDKSCIGYNCQLFTTVYTTEGISVNDCALALLPRMNGKGQLRV